jgi:Na+/melibiose symporter-like transporter
MWCFVFLRFAAAAFEAIHNNQSEKTTNKKEQQSTKTKTKNKYTQQLTIKRVRHFLISSLMVFLLFLLTQNNQAGGAFERNF